MTENMSWHRYLIGHKEGEKLKFDLGANLLAGEKFSMTVVIVQVKND